MRRLAALVLLLLLIPLPEARGASVEGMTLSILGDSISTYAGYSDNGNTNETIEGYRVFYPRWGNSVEAADTWWYQTAETLGLRLLVNNSFSGSCLLTSAHGAEGAYLDRCVQLHSNTGEPPDLIAVYLGTNDYYGYGDRLGTFAEIDFDGLIREDGYPQPKTAMEAYAVTLHKMKQRYPDAQIYCFTLLPLMDSPIQPEGFNRDILLLAEYFGCVGVDLYRCGIVPYIHMGDALHPEKAGMDAITAAFVSAILEHNGLDRRSVTYALTDTVSTGGTAEFVPDGKPFSTELRSPAPWLRVKVTMAGVDITAYCLREGKIFIDRVVGDLTVTAEPAESAPEQKPPDLSRIMGSLLTGSIASVK